MKQLSKDKIYIEQEDNNGPVLSLGEWRINQMAHGSKFLTGELTNISEDIIPEVQVQFRTYDDSGARIGSRHAVISRLRSGEKWRFEIHLDDADKRIELDRLVYGLKEVKAD